MGAIVGTSDWWIFWAVAGARFLLPLAIPRYPLPGIVASLLLDGVDQTVFQQFTGLPLAGYQGYDKALDIYYLAIAYISTHRNWANLQAFRVGRFLFYWRLVGVALFEITHLRLLLLIFPNTFEYFFIFYETFRLRWDPKRLAGRHLIAAAALIWIAIKLPQEYWIHIAQLDTTDWIKTGLLGMPLATPWAAILRARLGGFLAALAVAILFLVAAWLFVRRRLPPADRSPAFSADAYQPGFSTEQVRGALAREASRVVDAALAEKIVIIALVSISFAHVLPDVPASDLQLAIDMALLVTINAALSHWLARRGFGWAFSLRQFVLLAAVNAGLILVYALLRSSLDLPAGLTSALLFVLLLTLLVTLFDRYRQVYLMRFAWAG
jgi:hypothetical protein